MVFAVLIGWFESPSEALKHIKCVSLAILIIMYIRLCFNFLHRVKVSHIRDNLIHFIKTSFLMIIPSISLTLIFLTNYTIGTKFILAIIAVPLVEYIMLLLMIVFNYIMKRRSKFKDISN